jgi:signal transduction histidine kinase
LKNYEIESGLKSFALFFVLIMSIYLLWMWQNYTTKRYELDTRILQEMKIFSYEPVSDRFGVDFVPPDTYRTLLKLHHDDDEVYGYFRVPTLDGYLMKVSLDRRKYDARLHAIRMEVIRGAVLYLALIGLISLVLAYYSLHPIRQALRLNREFMKDILHDVNTPIASIAINLKLLEKRFGKHTALDRIANNVETIEMLRENIQTCLGDRPLTYETFDLCTMVQKRIEYHRVLYPQLTFTFEIPCGTMVHASPQACVRILDNLIGNAAKYNRDGGSVRVVWREDSVLEIADTGRGIRDVRKAFQRHYKEGERGMGLGLHIVRKLTERMGIDVKLRSEVGVGTTITLACGAVIQK